MSLFRSVPFVSMVVLLTAGIGRAADDVEAVPGEILVKVRVGYGPSVQTLIDAQADADSNEPIAEVEGGSIRKLHVRGSVESALTNLSGNSWVEYAEPNYILYAITIPNDPLFPNLWGLRNTGQVISGVAGTPGADIKAEPAWTVTTGTSAVVVGVVDTGIDYTHPDLAANVWSNPGGIGGCPAGTHGFNAILNTCNPLDDNNHGSHVSGTIGAVGNNGVGVVGVNWTTSIMGLKFLDSTGSGTTDAAILAIDFAVNAKIAGVNVRVLSNSWGGGGFSQALLDEINKANSNDILFVAAAGNSASNNDVTPHYPSSYNTANMIAVAATDNTDSLASFSNFGPTSVHLGAPGVDVESTVRNGGYAFFSGTSMATPHVSGAAALILSTQALTTAQLKTTILNNVDPLSSLSGLVVTGGRLNVCKAIPGCGGPPPQDFSLSVTPSSASVTAGSSASYTVNITRTGGFTGAVTFSISGLPTGASGSFSPNPGSGGSSTLTTSTLSTTPAGSYLFTVTGVSGSITHTATATLVVNAPGGGDFSLSATPSSQSIARATSGTYTVNIARTGGFSGAVTLSTSGLPSGTTGIFNPNPATGTSSTLTVSPSASSPTGTFAVTINGASGSLTRTTSVSLTITPGCIGGDGDC